MLIWLNRVQIPSQPMHLFDDGVRCIFCVYTALPLPRASQTTLIKLTMMTLTIILHILPEENTPKLPNQRAHSLRSIEALIIITERFKGLPAQCAGTEYEPTHLLNSGDPLLVHRYDYRSEWYHSGKRLYPSEVAMAASNALRR